MNRDYHLKSNVPQIILIRNTQEEPQQVTKVGIIPFIAGEDKNHWSFMLMKPHAEPGHPSGKPEFQIAKGTRRINVNGNWCDMRDDDLKNADPVFYENLIDAALREGAEEIGLKKSNILRLYDAGIFAITSARRNLSKAIQIFAAEINDRNDFGVFESKTAQVKWMTTEEWNAVARADHIKIMNEVSDRLISRVEL